MDGSPFKIAYYRRTCCCPRCRCPNDRHLDCPRASASSLHYRNRRQSMGRSRGGLTSKIHAVVDSNGLPVRLALSPGEAHDVRLAGKLLSRVKPRSMLLADRGYDADWIREMAMKKGARSQPGRTVLQQAQTMSSCGDALRQACGKLPCLRPTRIYPAMAGRAL